MDMSDFMQQNSGFLNLTWHSVIVGIVFLVLLLGVIAFGVVIKRGSAKAKFTVYDMCVVGVMTAVVFVVTYFIKIPVPTPAGQTMIKLANAFCLLAGMLFGGVRGGLAAGLGSMFYDLFDPIYITDAPLTLIRFFLMGFLCGVICFAGGRRGRDVKWNILGASAGAVFSFLFYFVQSLVKQLLLGQPLDAAFWNVLPKMSASAINTVVAVAVACLIAPVCMAALKRAGFYKKLRIGRP